MKSLLLIAALLATTPAQAQTKPLTYSLLMDYARFGALKMGEEFIKRGEPDLACIAARHLKQMATLGTPVPAEEVRLVQIIVNASCKQP